MTAETSTDAERLTVAIHESGHLIAALLSGVEWASAELDPSDLPALQGVTRLRGDALADHLVRAFVSWAGPWSEARFTGIPIRAVIASRSCAADRADFEMVTLFNPRAAEHWADLLDPHWSVIQRTAVAMVSRSSPVTPTDALPSTAHAEQVLGR